MNKKLKGKIITLCENICEAEGDNYSDWLQEKDNDSCFHIYELAAEILSEVGETEEP